MALVVIWGGQLIPVISTPGIHLQDHSSTVQPVHDLLEALQRDALLAVLKPEEAGGRHAELPSFLANAA